jgi:hypothetical protein
LEKSDKLLGKLSLGGVYEKTGVGRGQKRSIVMDTVPAIVVGLVLILYGLCVYKGKRLGLLTAYFSRFKYETDENNKKKAYKTYCVVFIIMGMIIVIIACLFYFKGIDTTKSNNLY